MATAAQAAPVAALRERSAAFLDYLDTWLQSLPDASLSQILDEAGGPARVAVVAVDVVNGFCVTGALASERVGQIVAPIRELFQAAHGAGVRTFAVLRDSHSPEAAEFAQFPPHCVAGAPESALVADLAGLPFAGSFADVPKNAINTWAGARRFPSWVAEQEARGVSTFVVAGDCTDLCVYQEAMMLKLAANAQDRAIDVIVPAACVETYDLPVETARTIGALPHDGDLLHAVFLYHLQLNGVRVVRRIVA
jgi:nicotinamidase-related amidase